MSSPGPARGLVRSTKHYLKFYTSDDSNISSSSESSSSCDLTEFVDFSGACAADRDGSEEFLIKDDYIDDTDFEHLEFLARPSVCSERDIVSANCPSCAQISQEIVFTEINDLRFESGEKGSSYYIT